MNQKNQNEQSKGYLIVASHDPIYYSWACNLIGGIKAYYPEAQVCLVVEERFVDARAEEADHIIFCDDHVRAKIWGMAQTPFDITFYIDADMECISEGISEVFDELGDADLVFTGLPKDRWHIFMDTEFPGGTFKLCGACCLYRKTEQTIQFMKDWYDLYEAQANGSWWPLDSEGNFDTHNYPYHLRIWDQFGLFWLVEKEEKYQDLKVEIFKDDLRWNYWNSLNRHDFPMNNVALVHMSSTATRNIDDIEL